MNDQVVDHGCTSRSMLPTKRHFEYGTKFLLRMENSIAMFHAFDIFDAIFIGVSVEFEGYWHYFKWTHL